MILGKQLRKLITACTAIFDIACRCAARVFSFHRNYVTVKCGAVIVYARWGWKRFIPLFYRSPSILWPGESDIIQFATPQECTFSDARNAVRYRHARKAAAIVERTASDARYAIAYRHARKAAAIVERTFSDGGHAVRYCHARKAAAILECTFSDARNAVRYRHARKAATTVECIVPDARYAIAYRHARKAAAI